MMPSNLRQSSFITSRLPDDIFDLNNDQFYDFIASKYGNDLAQLISFQSIRNGEHLLEATIDEIFQVLSHDSDEIDQLRRICCFCITGNEFKVKLGVKLTIGNLIYALKMQREETTKKKRRSINQPPSLSIHGGAKTSVNQIQMTDEVSSPTSVFSSTPLNRMSATDSQILRLQKNE